MDPTLKRNFTSKRGDDTFVQLCPIRNYMGSDGSHPEEKSDQGAMDPTPKGNLIREQLIPP